jgi:hypothetical protein
MSTLRSQWQNIKQPYWNKFSLLVTVVTTIWLCSDFSSRILSQQQQQNRAQVEFNIATLTLPNLPEKVVNELALAYKNIKPEKDQTKNKVELMSAQQQAQQQGKLQSVFAGDKKLQLKAVIQQKQINGADYLALLSVTDQLSGKIEIKSYGQLADVFGYQLKIDKNTLVHLQKTSEFGEQKITLLMFQMAEQSP